MKIDVNNAYRAYVKNAMPATARPDKREDKVGTAQQDRVAISAAAYKNDLDKVVYNTATELETNGSSARISELTQAVASGSYHVPTERLADAVLSTLI